MLIQIVQHTPSWVLLLLLALVAIGISRSRPRSVPLRRIFILPLAFTALSLFSLYSAFGANPGGPLNPMLALSALAWLCAAGVLLASAIKRGARRDVTYSAHTRRFQLPGSWLPLCWMISIFLIKYILAVLMAIQPSLYGSSSFAIAIGLLSGALNGILIGGAWRIWQVMQNRDGTFDPAGSGTLSPAK
jgi:hypothetical protein